jgi:hypothetical protein
MALDSTVVAVEILVVVERDHFVVPDPVNDSKVQ